MLQTHYLSAFEFLNAIKLIYKGFEVLLNLENYFYNKII